MVRIRLRRTGAKKQASYRVVAADVRSPRDGRFIETLGIYNPRTDPPTVELKAERVQYWLSVGAQPSESVEKLFRIAGIAWSGGKQKHSFASTPATPVATTPAATPSAAVTPSAGTVEVITPAPIAPTAA